MFPFAVTTDAAVRRYRSTHSIQIAHIDEHIITYKIQTTCIYNTNKLARIKYPTKSHTASTQHTFQPFIYLYSIDIME